jgi:DNA-binding Lrp family transcriptional regulator
MALSEADRRLLAAIESGLPLVPRPYLVLGERIGLGEGEVIRGLQALVARGVIRRFGLVVRHHELGYRANAMTVWDVPDGLVPGAAARLVELPFVTLCYRRPRRPPAWPYNLFCMIHGQDRARVEAEVEEATRTAGLMGLPRAVLFSRRRFKQRGARYGTLPDPRPEEGRWTRSIAGS